MKRSVKKFISIILILSLVFTNSVFSYAFNFSHIINEEKSMSSKKLEHKYFEMTKYEKSSLLLMKDDDIASISDSKENETFTSTLSEVDDLQNIDNKGFETEELASESETKKDDYPDDDINTDREATESEVDENSTTKDYDDNISQNNQNGSKKIATADETFEVVNNKSTDSEIFELNNIVDIEKASISTLEENDFGAPAYVEITDGWYDTTLSGAEKNTITKITFYNDTSWFSRPTTYDGTWDIDTAASDPVNRRLVAFRIGTELQIYSSFYPSIVLSNASNLFKDFSSLTAIENLNYLSTNATYPSSTSLNNTSGMFSGCSSLQTINLSSFTFSAGSGITDCSNMFENCTSLTSFTLTNDWFDYVNNASSMFKNCSSITTLDLSSYTFGSTTNAQGMFKNCTNLQTITLNDNAFSSLTDSSNMFNGCENLTNINLNNFDFSNITNANYMFASCSELTTISVNNNIRSLPVGATSVAMFDNCSKLLGGATYKYNSTHIDGEFARVDYGGVFPGYFTYTGATPIDYSALNISFPNNVISNFDTKKANAEHIVFSTSSTMLDYDSDYSWTGTIGTDTFTFYGYYINSSNTIYFHMKNGIHLTPSTNFDGGFSYYNKVKDITGLSLLDFSSVTSLFQLFSNDTDLTTIDLTSMDTSLVTSIAYMFDNCRNLTQVIIPPSFGSNAQNMATMFRNCGSLTTLDLTNLDTHSATNMQSMFYNCASLSSITFPANFAENATSMQMMFNTCRSLTTLDLANFSTANVQAMYYMFSGCSELVTLNLEASFNTTNVTDMRNMFENCSKLRTIYATTNFSVASVTQDSNMFAGCTALEGGSGTKFIDDPHTDKSYARLDILPGAPGYFSSNNIYRAKLDAGTGRFADDSSTKIVSIEAGDPTSSFEEPTKIGYLFNGWTVSGSALHPTWDYTTTRETIVDAIWVPISYNVTYDLNGGTGTFAPQPETYDSPFDLHPGEPTYYGYTFNCWKLSGTSRTFAAGATDLLNLTTTANDTITLIADWKENEFNIVFEKNAPISPMAGATNEVTGTMNPQTIKTNTAFTLKSNEYKLEGYTFIGWATQSYTTIDAEILRDNASPYIIPDKDTSHTYVRNANDSIRYFALWTRNKYKLKLAQNEEASSIPDPYVGEAEILFDTALSTTNLFNTTGKDRPHYTFTNKWTKTRLSTPLEKKNYHNTASPFVSPTDIFRETTELTLYSLWLNEEHTVHLETNGGTLPSDYTSLDFTAYYDAPYFTKAAPGEPRKEDGSLVEPIASLSEINMFRYWSEDATGTTIIDENTIYDNTAVTTIYANYSERQSFIISFDANGGSGKMEPISIIEGKSLELPYAEFTRSGYYSDKWKDQHANIYSLPYTINKISEPLTLYAIWTKSEYSGGGSNSGTNGGGGTGGRSTRTDENFNPTNGDGISNSVNNAIMDVVNNLINNNANNAVNVAVTNQQRNRIINELTKEIKNKIHPVTINKTLLTTILITEYDFDYKPDDMSTPIGIKLRTSSPLSNILQSSDEYKEMYKKIENDAGHLRLINGFYKVEYLGSEYYYALDKEGKILNGFVATNGQELITPTSETLNVNKTSISNLYYFYEEPGSYNGILWCVPIQIGKFLYTFDEQGRLASIKNLVADEDKTPTTSGAWEYNPETNNWAFYQIDANGNKTYAQNGLFRINSSDGNSYYYMFDENGKMKTGLIKYNGNTIYLQEKGQNRGAMYIGDITIKGIPYTFDEQGHMISSMDKRMQRTNNKRYKN